MKNIEKISDKVEKRKKQLQPLFTKDEENYNLWAGIANPFDTHPMSINVTGTELSAKALKSQASINRSRLDIHVLPPDKHTSPDAKDTANQEERMYYYILEKFDEGLSNIGEATLKSGAAWDTIVLGRTIPRVLVYPDPETGEVIFDLLPMIPRFVTFEFDKKGLAWVAYETFRSPSSIKSEYGKEVTEDMEGKGVSVTEYWDREHNVRYLTKDEEQLGKAWKHPFKDVPVVFQSVTLAPKAITNAGIDVKSWGQSMFDPMRDAFRTLNKLRSIWATHAHMLAKNPLVARYEGDTPPNIEGEHITRYPGALIKIPKSIDFDSLEQKDIPSSLPAMIADHQRQLDLVSYSELSPDEAGHSGAALRILGQDRQDVDNPRVGAINNMYTRMCKMVKDQIVSQGLTIDVKTVVGKSYHVYSMTPDLLDNDFYVRAELVRQDVYDEVEAQQQAQLHMQNRTMSREDIMERILREPDTKTQIEKMDMEDVQAAVPELAIMDRIIAYQEAGLDENGGVKDQVALDKAKLLKEKLSLLIAQQRQEVMSQEPPPEGAPTGGVTRPARPGGTL
jgi:hypothetical protein